VENNEEYQKLTLTDDNGKEIEFVILEGIEYANKKYLFIVENTDDEDNQDALILEEKIEEGEEVVYEIVEDTDLLDELLEIFNDRNDDINII